MDRSQAESLIKAEYKRLYGWDVDVTEYIPDAFGGDIAAVRAPSEQVDHEEVCYVDEYDSVRVFRNTEVLVNFLAKKANSPLIERIFSRQILTGVIFALVLIGVFVMGFIDKDGINGEALAILGSVAGLAAGFFYGSSNSRSSQ